MKHNLFKGLLSLALTLLISQPILAQSGLITPVPPESPLGARFAGKLAASDLKIDFKLADLKIENINGQLAKLNNALTNLEVRVAPRIAILDRRMEEALGRHRADDPEDNNISQNVSQPDADGKYVQASEKVKTMSKTYAADANDKLSISNQYGKVVVNTWAKKEFRIDIEIKSYESSDSKAQDQLDAVSISESRQGDLVSFKTNIDKKNISWWSRTRNGKEEKRGVQINYVVYMPAKNPLDITNRYGSTELPDLDGPLSINSSYGSFNAQTLTNPANRVKVSYGSANIEGYSSGILDVSYGSLKLANADKLSADIRYSSAKIGKLTSGGNLDLAYGDCKVESVDKSIKSLVINSSYSGLTMRIDEAANFNFDVTVSYAGFNFNDDKVNITSRTPDEHAKGWNPTK
ncbi:MAG TPA: hypothetical protein VLZ28_01190, partial [Daejeonella sp.]|nr:hypothetical protein [Daejeonella sp.]